MLFQLTKICTGAYGDKPLSSILVKIKKLNKKQKKKNTWIMDTSKYCQANKTIFTIVIFILPGSFV